MKSAKIVHICSFISGITLFILGIIFLIDIKTVSSQVQETSIPSSNSSSFSIVDNYTDNYNPINILVLVKEASGLNTDSIIIANYEPNTKQISLLTVPRDTKPSNKANYKVNSSYYIGLNKYTRSDELSVTEVKHKAAEYAAQSVSDLTNIPIDYYIYLEISTIKEIVDKLDGVYFDVPADLKYTDPTQKLYIDLKKGYQLLDGDKTEQLLRFRKSNSRASSEWKKYYDGSDLKRTEMQLKFLNELIQQKVNLLQLPKLIPIINYTFNNVITNTSLSDTLSLVSSFTKASRPSMNTFKLFGVDKRINNADYFIYNGKIEDTKSRVKYDSQEIIDKYFTSKSHLFIPDKNKKYDFETILNSNPSNSETNTHSDGKDKP
jgi:polyisoprenyl-teichoic acid--peptidoglycan teichoic acid transferase